MTKGSVQALAWGQKMQSIRSAGLRTEKQFFGPRGVFAKAGHRGHLMAHRKNPSGGLFDKDAARELELYGQNNADLYRQMEVPIRLNLERKYQKGMYQPVLAVKLWQGWADEAAKRYNKEFGGGGSKWFEMFSPLTRLHVAKEAESFHRREMELGNFQVVSKKNPITVVGNPSQRVSATVAGVLYNRCVEIRAEKTSAGPLRGLYYHPFSRRSKVCVLALDNGDILIHSQAGEKLWKLD
jgi:hypothetical protein